MENEIKDVQELTDYHTLMISELMARSLSNTNLLLAICQRVLSPEDFAKMQAQYFDGLQKKLKEQWKNFDTENKLKTISQADFLRYQFEVLQAIHNQSIQYCGDPE